MWLLLSAVVLAAWLYYHMVHKRKQYPPGPMPLPLIGNLHQLGGKLEDWPPAMNKWGQEYGGIYTMWIPSPKVVITKYDLHKEAWTGANSEKTSGRPKSWMFEYMFGGCYGLFLPEGYFWREQRRFTMHVLRDFGFARTAIMEDKIKYDLDRMVQYIEKHADKQGAQLRIDLDTPVATTLASVINSLISGKRYDFDDQYFQKFFKLNREMFEIFSDASFFMLDGTPILRFSPFIFKPFLDNTKKVMDQFHDFFMEPIKEHKKAILANPDEEAEDLMSAYLKEMENRKRKGEPLDTFSEYQLWMTVFDLWSAAMETSTVSLRWMYLMMCKHPDIQRRMRDELTAVCGDRSPSLKDQPQLPLTRAIITESWRYNSLFPVSVDRRAIEEVHVGGHRIPKDTAMNMHMDSVLCDPTIFADPRTFNPDRFIKSDGTFDTTLADRVFPFGMGKRQCVGEGLARMNILLIFTTIVQRFKLSLPDDLKVDPETPVFKFTRMPTSHETLLEPIK